MADTTSSSDRSTEATRRSLHAVAEHVLGAALHAATGHIGLRATPGGFGTPVYDGPGGPRQLRVDGTELVFTEGSSERRAPLTTIRAAAELAGTTPGAPADVSTPVTPLDLDEPLAVDPTAAARLATLFAVVDEALARLRARHGDGDAGTAQLWPEHFDLAVTIAEVNYGGSPGDDQHADPYLYVGPWTVPTDHDAFWNEPFGASTGAPADLDVGTAVRFFESGRARLTR